MRRFFIVLLLLGCLASPRLGAETSSRDQLLHLVPADFGFCLVVNDLKGQTDAWKRSGWLKAWMGSPVGKIFLQSPEIVQLQAIHAEMKRRLGLSWDQLRDEVLGDAVVLAYRPALPMQPETEQGILLLRSRKAELLAQLLDRVNEEQKKTGELKQLIPLDHQGAGFFRRVDGKQSHFYALDQGLLIYTGNEELMRSLLERRKKPMAAEPSPIVASLGKAGADRAWLALWANPRAFEPELEQKVQKETGKEALMLQAFLSYWKPLEGIVISFSGDEDFQGKLTLQARAKDLPPFLRQIFHEPTHASEVWSRFPKDAIFTLAGRVDAHAIAEALGDFSTPDHRRLLGEQLQKTMGAALGLDLGKELWPNLGPDWGVCLVGGEPDQPLPQWIAALGVHPGPKEVGVDQALFKGVQFLAGLAVFDYNRKNPHPIRMKSVMQDRVEVKYLVNDKAFPPGIQPAWALKDGYLLLASSPAAILMFQPQNHSGPETPLLHLSALQLTKYLRNHRNVMVEFLAEKNQIPRAVANQGLDSLLSFLDLIDQVTLFQTTGSGQASWTLRIRPRS